MNKRLMAIAVLLGLLVGATTVFAQTRVVFWYSIGGPNGEEIVRMTKKFNESQNAIVVEAHISGELPDGRVSLRFSGERFDAKLPRADLRLPPPEVKQPNVASPFDTTTPAAVSPAASASLQFRTWSDASGAFQIEAKLIEHLGESVRLVRKDGKEVVVPLARLSEADRQYAATATKAENPFER